MRKRDGRVVPFQRQKIADAVAKALEAAGEGDARFASEVAGIVALSLEERVAGERASERGGEEVIPHIETIQDLVERALMELGRPAVAKAYILHRDLRARMRSVLRVHRSDTLRAPVRVREREGVSDWSKGRIVAALMHEAELPREAAEDVASAVERRVFAAGKRTVTTGLVRELVASELFERGWTAALTAARVVGLPRLDVRRILAGSPLHPWDELAAARARPADAPAPRGTAEALAGELLERHALDGLLPEAAAELVRAGDLDVVGLGSHERALTLALDAELLCAGGAAPQAAYAVLDQLAELTRRVAHGIVLERPAAVLAPLVRSTREASFHGLSAWLRALAALAQASGVRLDLGTPGARYHAATARLVEELAELEGPFAPRLFLEGGELEALLEERADLVPLVERLLAAARLVPTWSGSDALFAGPGCERRAGERGVVACGVALAINLPRIARRAGPFREELVQGALAELVQAALEIAQALARVQPPLPGQVRARSAAALVPVGLREALLLLGDGTIDCALGARLLGFLGEAARRFARDGRLAPTPCPFLGAGAAARFAYLDARARQEAGTRQEWLFGEAEAALGETRPYTSGFQLAPLAGFAPGRAEAELLRTVPCGALDCSALAPEGEPLLPAWRRFETQRRAQSGELVLELFPRPRVERSPSRLRPLV
ncbi:MAG TPA: ATP cone domain-containing protein [Planctomycetota bacterium]